MFYFTAISELKKDMSYMLEKEGLKDYSFSLERMNNAWIKGEHDIENKNISINTDNLHYQFKQPSGDITASIVPKIYISQISLDKTRITSCHEIIHAKDFSHFLENIHPKERERFALEDICCTNPRFYKGEGQPLSLTNYHKISFEARAYTKSIYMARDMIMERDGISEEEANQRIINVLNYNISRDSLFHVDRENPNYNPYKTTLLDEDLEQDNHNRLLDDVSFHNFEEVEQCISKILDKSKNHIWKPPSLAGFTPGLFPSSSSTKEKDKMLGEINEEIKAFRFSEQFYDTLEQIDRLYLNAAITIKFYDRYKEVNPNIRNLPERLEKYTNMKVLDLNKLDIRYFERKLEDFLKEHPEFDKEKSPERDSGLF